MSRSTPVRNALRTMGQLPLESSTLRRLAEEASENTPIQRPDYPLHDMEGVESDSGVRGCSSVAARSPSIRPLIPTRPRLWVATVSAHKNREGLALRPNSLHSKVLWSFSWSPSSDTCAGARNRFPQRRCGRGGRVIGPTRSASGHPFCLPGLRVRPLGRICYRVLRTQSAARPTIPSSIWWRTAMLH